MPSTIRPSIGCCPCGRPCSSRWRGRRGRPGSPGRRASSPRVSCARNCDSYSRTTRARPRATPLGSTRATPRRQQPPQRRAVLVLVGLREVLGDVAHLVLGQRSAGLSAPSPAPGLPISATAVPAAAIPSEQAGERAGDGGAGAGAPSSRPPPARGSAPACARSARRWSARSAARRGRWSEGAAGPIATLRSDSVTDSPRAAASAARPRSPADG